MLPGLASGYSTLLTRPLPLPCRGSGSAQTQGNWPSPSMVLVPSLGIPLPPGSFGVGKGVTELGVFPALPKLFLGGDGMILHHGSLTWGSPHTLLSGVLDWQWDAPSLHHTSLAAFHFPRDSRNNWGDPAQPLSGVPLTLSCSAWRSGRAGESCAGKTQWELFGPELLGKLSSLSPAPGNLRQARGGRVIAALSPQRLCL